MKKYLITDPSFYTSDPQIFSIKLLHVIDNTSPDLYVYEIKYQIIIKI